MGNKKFIEFLEKFIGEYDHYLQEGVIFEDSELLTIEDLLAQWQSITIDLQDNNEQRKLLTLNLKQNAELNKRATKI